MAIQGPGRELREVPPETRGDAAFTPAPSLVGADYYTTLNPIIQRILMTLMGGALPKVGMGSSGTTMPNIPAIGIPGPATGPPPTPPSLPPVGGPTPAAPTLDAAANPYTANMPGIPPWAFTIGTYGGDAFGTTTPQIPPALGTGKGPSDVFRNPKTTWTPYDAVSRG